MDLISYYFWTLVDRIPQTFFYPSPQELFSYIGISFCIGLASSYLIKALIRKTHSSFALWRKKHHRAKRISSIKVKNGVYIGEVTQFLSKLQVAVIQVNKKNIKIGDTLLFKGKSSNIIIPVKSLQINGQAVQVVKKGTEAGLLVGKQVAANDLVFKIKK